MMEVERAAVRRISRAQARKRRKRAAAVQWLAKNSLYLVAAAVVLVLFFLVTVLAGQEDPHEFPAETLKPLEVIPTLPAETVENQPFSAENYVEPFCGMLMDWGTDAIKGLKWYAIPVAYRENGGAFPEVVQAYTYCLCNQYGIDYAVAVALIERESGYKWDASSGIAHGYMQVVPEWHQERMQRLGVTDLLNPYGGILTGLDYLDELVEKYGGNYGKALTAYNWGPTGAYKHYFSQGINTCEYALEIMERAEELRPLVQEGGQA